MENQPLAQRLRPTELDMMVGQEHILGEGTVLRNMIESRKLANMIFYGPSGTGKTTLAGIIARKTDRTLYKLNATTATLSDVREVIADSSSLLAPNGVLLYLDEIQYFNKKQQQSLLEFIETGSITMIAATTENPYFYVYNAILSRCTVFEFKPVSVPEVKKAVARAIDLLSSEIGTPIVCEEGVEDRIASGCGGDVRKALNALELLVAGSGVGSGGCRITLEQAQQVSQRSAMRYDRDADEHYDILSALQKSIRGSDPDAALHYAARLIEAGDLLSLCRRVLVCASEDIGLAYPAAVSIVKSCVDSALQLGLPEARIPMAQAIILLCTSPKSNSAINAIDAALADIKSGHTGEVPPHLKDGHYSGAQKMGRAIDYKYPHLFENHYVEQQYLPDNLKDAKYYEFGDNKTEAQSRQYWEKIKNPPKK